MIKRISRIFPQPNELFGGWAIGPPYIGDGGVGPLYVGDGGVGPAHAPEGGVYCAGAGAPHLGQNLLVG